MLQILNTLTSELTIVEPRGIKDTLGMEVHEQIQNLFMIHDNSEVLQRTSYMMIVMIIIILSVAVNKEYIFFRANNVFIMLSYDFFYNTNYCVFLATSDLSFCNYNDLTVQTKT